MNARVNDSDIAEVERTAVHLSDKEKATLFLRRMKEQQATINANADEADRLTKLRDELASEVRRLKRREADIVEACEHVTDGGQYRNDVVSAIQRIRRERDEARAEAQQLRDMIGQGK